MKLNKLERYTAYCIFLEEAENPNYGEYIGQTVCNGLCFMWGVIFDDTGLYEFTEELLPEYFKLFFASSPVRGWDERIAILKACIIETHPENKKP